MKNEDIYKAALHLVGELNSEQTAWNADYLERSGYLLAMVCRQCEPVENLFRAANGQDAVTLPDQLCYLMTVTFPLSPPLSTAAAFGLAALLVADENPELSGELHDRFRQSLSEILAALPMKPESITDRYASVWQV